jgi:SAM-dependent methyltransferase
MDLLEVAELYQAYKASSVSCELHPNDAMYRSGPEWYYSVGESGVYCILSALAMTRLRKARRILDLPCGHGRVGRHLRAAFPSAELFFSDLDKDGVDFCSAEFKGAGIYSDPDLTRVELPRELDVIWVGSLFTHVSRARTFAWLCYLAGHLRSHGILVASFHGYFTVYNPPSSARVDVDKLRREFQAMGYGFDAYGSHDPIQLGEYGFSVSKPSHILDLADAIPDTRVVSYTERGWAQNHDVLVLCGDDRLRPF